MQQSSNHQIWFAECPVETNGLICALMTATDVVVLMCDECGEVWLTPESVGITSGAQPREPEWTVAAGVAVTPGTTRWATLADLPDEWRTLDWRSLA